MSSFDLQTCETRTWIDVLAENLLIEVIGLKGRVCDESSNLFSTFGLTLSPCDFLTDENFDILQSGDTPKFINVLLLGAGLPPHTVEILDKGYDNLEAEKQQDVEKWLQQAGLAATIAIQSQIVQILQEKITPPPPETVKNIITRLNNISRTINPVTDKLNRVASATEKAAITVNTIDQAITVIDGLVIATDIALATSAATPTGIAATFARAVQKLERYADRFRGDIRGPSNKYGEKGLVNVVCRVSKVVLFAQTTIIALQSIITVITRLLEALLQEQIASESITPTEVSNTVTQAAQGFVLDNTNNTYKGYRIEIKTDPDSPAVAPRRYAVAIDRYGVVVLEGRPSFSSSTEILVNEIKYQIDRLGR